MTAAATAIYVANKNRRNRHQEASQQHQENNWRVPLNNSRERERERYNVHRVQPLFLSLSFSLSPLSLCLSAVFPQLVHHKQWYTDILVTPLLSPRVPSFLHAFSPPRPCAPLLSRTVPYDDDDDAARFNEWRVSLGRQQGARSLHRPPRECRRTRHPRACVRPPTTTD